MQIVDYSLPRPGAAAIKAAGFVGAIRYLSPPPNEKNWTAAQVTEHRQAGLALGFVWEIDIHRPDGGHQAGVDDGRRANLMADDLGVPDSVAIYFACDFRDQDPAEAVTYFTGIFKVARRPVGVYGSMRVCSKAVLKAGARYAWQVETWGPRVSDQAHIVQLPNQKPSVPGTDPNDVKKPDWGAWAPSNEGENELDAKQAQQLRESREDLETLNVKLVDPEFGVPRALDGLNQRLIKVETKIDALLAQG